MSTSVQDCSANLLAAFVAVTAGLGPLSPAKASDQGVSTALTSHLPWLAPTGHRQPKLAEAPRVELLSSWERQRQAPDVALDRKLIICRGC